MTFQILLAMLIEVCEVFVAMKKQNIRTSATVYAICIILSFCFILQGQMEQGIFCYHHHLSIHQLDLHARTVSVRKVVAILTVTSFLWWWLILVLVVLQQ
jgi:hypothetical protein